MNYNFPAIKLIANHVQPYKTTSNGAADTPLVNTLPRSTALRSLGGMSNCFANESFMDELALKANADPIAFRKKYVCALTGGSGSATSVPVNSVDPRAVAALDAMAQQAGWGSALAAARAGAVAGKGVAFARYETVETYVAVYAEVEVTHATGEVWVRRVVVAHDCGLIINPDGLKIRRRQRHPGHQPHADEEVGFNTTGVTSCFKPPRIQHLRRRPSTPGAFQPGAVSIEFPASPRSLTQDPANVPSVPASHDHPVAPAIANAIFQRNRKRLTVLPITKQLLYALTHGQRRR